MRRLLVPLLLLGASHLLHSSILHPGIGLLGQPCDPNPDKPSCSVANSTCSGGKCVCARGFSDSKSGLCLPISFSSTSLNASTQVTKFCKPACHATTEICYQGNCVCAGGHVRVQNNCQPVALLLKSAAPAAGDLRRSPTYGQSSQSSSSYVNRPYPGNGQLRSPANSVQAVPPDSVCGSDADCAGYPLAFCDGVCRCVAGALNAGSTCISNGNSISVSGTCPPGQSYVTEAGSCMTTAVPGEPCQYSQQCSATEPGAFCLRLKCECVYGMKQSGSGCTFADSNCAKRGFIWIPELGECKEVIPPGGRGCSHNLQCSSSFPGSTCFLQTCACPSSHPVAIDGTCGRNCTAGLTYSGVTGQCLPTVQPGDQCLYSSQCHAVHPGIGCDRGRCRCPRDEVFTGNGCSITCPSGYRANSRGICSPGCRSNQVEHEGECLDASVAGQACVVNAQCTGGSSCQDSLCKCTRGMTAKGGICVAIESAPLGSCANGEICGGGSFCSNGNCTCPVGRQVLNGRCVTPITVPPNSPCTSAVQCGGGSDCVSNVCECPANQIALNDVCQLPPTVPAGGACPSGFERCLGQSICVDGVCSCPSGTVVDNGVCVAMRQALPGASCNAATRCLHLSVCVDGQCQCPAGTSIQDGVCRASTAVSPGSDCGNGQICSGGSLCINTRCTCPPGTQARDGQCQRLLSAKPGQTCAAGEICTGGSNCDSGVCICPIGTVNLQGYCQTAKSSLGVCDTNAQCTGGSYCDLKRKQCMCPAGRIAVGSVCIPLGGTGTSVSESRPDLKSRDDSCSYDQDCPRDRVCVLKRCECLFGEDSSGECFPSNSPFSSKLVLSQRKMPVDTLNTLLIEKIRAPSTHLRPSIYGYGSSTHLKPANGKPEPSVAASNDGDTIDVERVHLKPGITLGHPTQMLAPFNPMAPLIARAKQEEKKRGKLVNLGGIVDTTTNTTNVAASSSTIGSRCSTTSDCPSSSVCNGGYCACPPGTTRASATSCTPITTTTSTTTARTTTTTAAATTAQPTGRRCLAANQCPSGADCIQGECKCTQGLTLSRFGFCIPVTYAGPGEPCPQGTQCRGGATCAYGNCVCPPEHDARDGKCAPRGLSLSPPSTYSSPSNTYTLHYDARPGNGLSPCPGDGSCTLPHCACSSSGTAPPASLLPSQTPQMIVITFEGAVTDRTTRIYKSLFSGRLRSHDCPLRATFFVSHEYTNYDQVQWLAARGNEIAVAGMGSTSLSSRSEDRWRAELQGMRMALAEFSKIEVESIRGVRAPGMKTGGDSHFSVLAAWNFTYDHSIAPDGGPFWPQTLDHTLPFMCTDGSCPTKAFKGVWEAPVNRIITTDGRSVARLREAIRSTDTRASVTDLLKRNLQRNYQGSRAPLVLSLDADFMFALPQNEAVNGLIDFLEEALAKDDVYPVTVSQMISWMKSPTSLDRLAKFKPFHCPRRANDHVQPCEAPSTCSFVTPQGSRSFRVCGSCPRDYPNIDDPLGKGRR